MSSRRVLVVTCWLFIVIGACGPGVSTILADDPPAVSELDYPVYNALLDLMQFQKKDIRMLIADTTLNFECGVNSGNPVLMNGYCSGMRIPPDEPNDIMQILQRNWPAMETATWEDFAKQSADSARLHDDFSTSWKHKVAASALDASRSKEWASGAWASPDLTIFFSRVGFNTHRTEAVVYCLTFSYVDEVPTEGDYFMFRTDAEGWKPQGRVTYIQKDGNNWTVAK